MTNIEIKNREVDLLALLPIVAKRRVFILSSFLVFAAFSFVLIFLGPEPPMRYEVSEILKLPMIGVNKYSVTLLEIKAKIKDGIYDYRIMKAIGLSQEEYFSFDVSAVDNGDFFKVGIQVNGKNTNICTNILNGLFTVLKNWHNPIISRKKSEFEEQVFLLQNRFDEKQLKIQIIDDDIKKKRATIEEKNKRIIELDSLVSKFDQRNNLGFEQFVALNDKALKSILNEKDIQEREGDEHEENLSFVSSRYEDAQVNLLKDLTVINNTLSSLKVKRGELATNLVEIKKEKDALNNEIEVLIKKKEKPIEHRDDILIDLNKLVAEMEAVSNFIQIQPPVKMPILKRENKINKMYAFLMIGLALSLFLAFFLEFWVKLKTIKS